ncbi:tetratricopeptide repeat protein [Aneurinibacillus sp. REN35]|uniref:hypothetical protein n=1 Tax=Aneurinibacillus sp. REN35 TaxID=3237286 RepID=UPI003528EF3A
MYIVFFFVLHTLALFLLSRLLLPSLTEEKRGAASWIFVVSIFLPFIGEILGLIVWLAEKKTHNRSALDTYDEYTRIHVDNYENIIEEAANDYRLLPIMQSLEMDDSEIKKEMLIRLLDLNIGQKGKYLYTALQNEDTEVVHYAATSINVLKDRYIRRISSLRNQLRSENPAIYLELAQVYQHYLESDLLTGEMKHMTALEYHNVLKLAIQIIPTNPHLVFQQAEVCLLLRKNQEAEELGRRLIHQFPAYFGGYLIHMQLAYHNENWPRIREMIQRMREQVSEGELPPRWVPVLRQLEGA